MHNDLIFSKVSVPFIFAFASCAAAVRVILARAHAALRLLDATILSHIILNLLQ